MTVKNIDLKETSWEFIICDENKNIIDFLQNNQIGKKDEKNEKKFVVYNVDKYLFKEEDYFESAQFFSQILDKMYIKSFDAPLYYISETKGIKKLENEDFDIYIDIVKDNIIDNLEKNKVKISIQILNRLEENEIVKKIKNIYILLFLSNSTKYDNGVFNFQIKSDDYYYEISINYKDDMAYDLTPIYEWIIDNKKHTNVYKIKLNIIRSVIAKNKNFNLLQKDILNCDSIFNRVINNEVRDYFEQVNLLKDDLIKLEDEKSRIQHSLHLKFLTWLSAIGITIFDAIKDSGNLNLIDLIFFSVTQKIQIILGMLAVALMAIFGIYIFEYYQHTQKYERIKKFYIEKFFFAEDDFKNYIQKPKKPWIVIILFVIILFGIFLRIFH